jgi:hypothetical protein
VAYFETLKVVVGCTRAWMTSDGGFDDTSTGRLRIRLGGGLALAT